MGQASLLGLFVDPHGMGPFVFYLRVYLESDRACVDLFYKLIGGTLEVGFWVSAFLLGHFEQI